MDTNLDGPVRKPKISHNKSYDESAVRGEIPMLAALLYLKAEKRLSFHMPGHRNGQNWPSWLSEQLASIDTTELPVSMNLLRPEGAALEAMQLAADCFGAGWTRFLTSGSTTAIFSLLAACPGRGGRILTSRTCHQSVMHAAALLDLELGWITPSDKKSDDLGFLPQTTSSDIEAALQKFGQCDAILITSPDYYGSCADIESISRLAHSSGAVLLVDEAHGAHFCAAPELLPRSAMASGADACVQSAHKTLSSLTPAAMIHISQPAIAAKRLDPVKIENMLKVFHTSSPSYMIAASMDFARWQLSHFGHENVVELIKNIQWLKHRLPAEFAVSSDSQSNRKGERDLIRLVIGCSDHRLSVRSLARALQSQKIDIEMQDLRRLVLIPSLGQPLDDFRQLADVCCRWLAGDIPSAGQVWLSKVDADNLTELDQQFSHWLTTPSELAVMPGKIMFGNLAVRSLPWDQAEGRIAAEAVVPYPPGIPLIWPGERLGGQKLAFIWSLSENDLNLTGFSDGSLSVLD